MATRGVYAIKNKATGKIYIGASSNIEHRWLSHRACSANVPLRHAINDCGLEAFTFEILEVMDDEMGHLNAAERRWIGSFDERDLYNIQPFRIRRYWAAYRNRALGVSMDDIALPGGTGEAQDG